MPEVAPNQDKVKVTLHYNYSRGCGNLVVYVTEGIASDLGRKVRNGQGVSVTAHGSTHSLGPGIVYRMEKSAEE